MAVTNFRAPVRYSSLQQDRTILPIYAILWLLRVSSLCLICSYSPVFFFYWTIIFLTVLLTNAPRTFIPSEASTQTSAPYLRVDRYLSITKYYLVISGGTSAQIFVTVYVVMTGKQPHTRRRKRCLCYKSYCSTVHFCRITSIYQPTNAHIISHKTLSKHFKITPTCFDLVRSSSGSFVPC